MNFINKFFELDALKTNIRTEILGGLTTFAAMSYILFVNPSILSLAGLGTDMGLDAGAVFTATALTTALGTLIMGLYAKHPIAIAPAMGVNSFFAFTLVYSMGIPWQTALSSVFVSGILFTIIAVSGLRETIMNVIPKDLKMAISAGIGLFIAFIGMRSSGILVGNPETLVALGDFTEPHTLLAAAGLITMVILMSLSVKGAIFLGMAITSIFGVIFGLINAPSGVVGAVPSIAPTFGVALFNIQHLFSLEMIIIVFTFLFLDFFDTAGTLIAVTELSGLADENGNLPRTEKALLADSISTIFGSLVGTSTAGAYIESTSGIAVGAKSGLASVVTGLMFLLALFFSPLLSVITAEVTAPALILVGILMASTLKDINWNKYEIAVPSFFAVVLMPLANSIVAGFAVSFIFYPLTMTLSGRRKEVHAIMWILAVLFILYLAFLTE